MSVKELSSLYSTRPDLYDLMHEDLQQDAAFLRDLVRAHGPGTRVVELGCGTGRLMAAMLEAGAVVTGVDREPSMLRVARDRLAGHGDRVQFHQADMRAVQLAAAADLVVVGLNTFMHLLTTRDQLAALARAHALLRPGGTLVLDLANPLLVTRDSLLGVQQHRFTKQNGRTQQVTTLWSVTTTEPAEQLVHSLLFFDELHPETGAVRRTLAEVILRLIFRFELDLLLARSGFALHELLGDYDSEPYTEDSERMLALATALA